jgi:sn-glycerol 3-phosphate transport system substrate-binding protein
MLSKWLLGATLSLALAQSAGAETKITFWHSLNDAALQVLVKNFNAAQSEVQVEQQFVGNYGEAVTKLQAAIVAGRQPDIAMLEITRYGLFADRGQLEPLDGLVSAELKADILPSIWGAAQYKAKGYVLPFNSSTAMMYYNKDLFRKAGLDPSQPPKTWDELVAAAHKLTQKDGAKTTQWGVNATQQWVRWGFAHQNRGEWVDPATNAVMINERPSVEAYRFFADLVLKENVASADAAMNEDVAKQMFIGGQAAITFDSSGALGDLKRAAKFDLGAAALPCQAVCASPIGGATLGILAKAPPASKQAAWKFIEWMLKPENNAYWFVETGYLPIRRATLETQSVKDLLAKNPDWAIPVKQLEVGFGRARPPAMPAIRSKEEVVWQSVIVKKDTVDKALDDFAQEMKRMISADAG